jgi:uncharacterized protein YndB with AHSA1/START domain
MQFTTTVEIAASPLRVWELMFDVERWPEWTASVTRVQRLDQRPFGVGSRVRVEQPGFPPARWRVVAVQPGDGFTWVSSAPGLRVYAHHIVEPYAGGSRVTLVLRFKGPFGPLFGWLTRSVNVRYMRMEAEGLKRRAEED